MSPKEATHKPAKRTTSSIKKSKGFTDEERAAMKERAQELKAETRRSPRADQGGQSSAAGSKSTLLAGGLRVQLARSLARRRLPQFDLVSVGIDDPAELSILRFVDLVEDFASLFLEKGLFSMS